jgi:hypothetical protein
MMIEPFFSFLTGMAALVFASAAYLEFLGGHRSAMFDTVAAGASASLLFLHLPRSTYEILLICLFTAIAELMVTHGETVRQARGRRR